MTMPAPVELDPRGRRLRAALAAVAVCDRAREGGYAVAAALVGIPRQTTP
jgi:hypothetical protein